MLRVYVAMVLNTVFIISLNVHYITLKDRSYLLPLILFVPLTCMFCCLVRMRWIWTQIKESLMPFMITSRQLKDFDFDYFLLWYSLSSPCVHFIVTLLIVVAMYITCINVCVNVGIGLLLHFCYVCILFLMK